MIPKRTFFVTWTALLAVALSALVAGAAIAVQQPNFSGTWLLDAEASEVTSDAGLAGLGGNVPENLHITHARNGSVILSSLVNGAQPRAYMIGGETDVPAPGGETARMTMASAWQGSELVNEGATEFEGAPLQVHEVLSMSADGETLQLTVTTTLAGTASTNVLVYTRAAR